MKQRRLIPRPIVWLTLFLSCAIATLWAFDCTVNITSSMPIGLWHVSQVTPPLESLRHKAILFCPPDTEVFRWAKSNGVLNCGRCPGDYTPLLKEVVGLPGDVVEFDESRVYINGQVLPRSEIYWLGMNSLEISHVIKAGSIWVVGTGSNRSFDSRYFGDISITNILGVAEPILVLERTFLNHLDGEP